MRRFFVFLMVLVVVGFLGLQWLKSNNTSGVSIPITVGIPIILTPTTAVITGPMILDSIHNQAKLETVEMSIANDQTLVRTWGFQGACTENVTYLGYFNVTAGIDLQTITPSDITVIQTPGETQPSITIKMPPAELLHAELDTQRSRVIHDDVSLISQLCGSNMAEMVTQAQKNIQNMAVSTALDKGILTQAQDRANLELQRLLLNAGYSKVTFQNPAPIDPR
jgi:hypothetical protein